MIETDCVLSVDIGGTKTAVALFDTSGRLLADDTFPTRPERGAPDLVEDIAKAAGHLAFQTGRRMIACGVISPGPLDTKRGIVLHAPVMGWHHVPLVDLLRERMGIPCILENDASAAALGEWKHGAGCDNMAYITVSTGVGCGVIADGRLLRGARGLAAELGHLCVETNGLPCPCGKHGCLELYASGTSIAVLAGQAVGRALTTPEVFALSLEGDARCTGIIRRASRYLGFAIATLYQILDPGCVVIGGGVAAHNFEQMVPYIYASAVTHTEPVPGRRINIVKSALGGKQGLYGGAALALELAAIK